jgi:hypothetical protein
MTTTTGPLATVEWRLYVRFTDAHGRYHDVDVPYRSIQPPLAVRIRPGDVTAFRVGDQVTAAEIAALGGDTLARLVNGARAYVAARPAEYPQAAAGAMTLRWAKRDP